MLMLFDNDLLKIPKKKIIETPSLWQKDAAPNSTVRMTADDKEQSGGDSCAC